MDNRLSSQTDNRKKDILVLGEGSTDAFDDSKIMMKATFSVKITKSKK